jgi:hypothetical protein
LYIVLTDLPKPVPFGQDKPGMSHSVDELIGNTTHHAPQPQQPLMYGTPQYISAFGGTPYYPPPPYPQQYPIALPPPISGPPLTPTICPPIQTISGTPSTSAYTLSTRESTTPSYVPYRSLPKNNPYFPFPGLPQPIAPPQGHLTLGLIFFNPLPFSNIKILNS